VYLAEKQSDENPQLIDDSTNSINLNFVQSPSHHPQSHPENYHPQENSESEYLIVKVLTTLHLNNCMLELQFR
jgi:hypothetical protein